MTMRTKTLFIAGAIIGTLTASSAQAATTTHLVLRGTAADLSLGASLPTTQPDCNLDVSLSLTAATSVQHVEGGGGTGAGAQGFIQINDFCAAAQEFGSFDVALPTGLTTTSRAATLNTTVVVTMSVFDPDFNFVGTVNRTFVFSSLQFDSVSTDTQSSKSHTSSRFPGFFSVSNGQTVERPANLTGGVTLDGQALLPNPTAGYSASFQTSHNVSVTVTK
jgi:hypothetical protein